jgi:hypothetical protein
VPLLGELEGVWGKGSWFNFLTQALSSSLVMFSKSATVVCTETKSATEVSDFHFEHLQRSPTEGSVAAAGSLGESHKKRVG